MPKHIKHSLLTTIVSVSSLLFFNACQKEMSLPLYEGYDFDAMIGKAHVIELKDQSSIPALDGYVRDVHWQLDRAINGKIVAKYAKNKNTDSTIGTLRSIEAIDVVPLTRVRLDSHAGIQSDNSVLIGGHAALTKVDILKSNVLPKGDYVLRLKIHGIRNWDRKEVYVQVR